MFDCLNNSEPNEMSSFLDEVCERTVTFVTFVIERAASTSGRQSAWMICGECDVIDA